MTDKKEIYIISLLALSVFFLEAWQIFSFLDFDITPFILKGGYSLNVQWYLKDLGGNMCIVCLGLLVHKLSKLWFRINVIAGGFIFYAVTNLLLFILCYNTWSYIPVYLLTILFIIGYWYHKKFGIVIFKRKIATAPFNN